MSDDLITRLRNADVDFEMCDEAADEILKWKGRAEAASARVAEREAEITQLKIDNAHLTGVNDGLTWGLARAQEKVLEERARREQIFAMAFEEDDGCPND